MSVLVVFGGLPGTGKTSVAREVAAATGATFLRVDTVEVAIERGGLTIGESPAGYTVTHAVAADQLRAGRDVVVDAVNPVRPARQGWEQTAAACGAQLRFVRVVLGNVAEHRRRVESRTADIAGHRLPTWADVQSQQHDDWTEPHLELDNSSSLEGSVERVLAWLAPGSADERVARGVRRLTVQDAGELLTLQLAAWVREAHANATLAIPTLHETLEDVQGQLGDPDLLVWGVREHGRLIATVRMSELAGRPERTAFLGRLGVVPDLIGQGLGAAMLRHAEAHRPAGTTRIELITGMNSLDNHAFYERKGYRIVDRNEAAGYVVLTKPAP